MAEGTLGSLDNRTQMLESSFMALGAATAALGYGLMRIAQSGMAVEQTLAMVEATSGATAHEMSLIRNEVQQLGKELPVSTRDAANAMKELSFAGFDAQQSVAAVGAVAELASASTLSVAQSAEITANALNQFSLQADQAAAVADLAAGAFSSSSMTMEQFAEAMNYAGNAAAVAGFNITETTAALTVMADAGLKGSRAGTALQAALTQLASPSSAAADALESVGLSVESFTDSEGDFKSMAEIAAILNENLSDLPEAQRLQVLTDVFGVRGARGMAALMENTEKLNEQLMSLSASQLKGAMDAVSEADAESIREINTELQRLEGMAATAQLTPSMNTQQMLSEFQSVSSQLSQEELALQIQTAFDVDEEAASRLAAELQMGTDVGAIAAELERAQDAGGLTAAQMATLSGKVEYLRGTLETITFSMFEGMKPILSGIADGVIVVADALAEHETAAKAAGVAALFLLGGLATLTTVVGSLIAIEYAAAAATTARAGAQRVSAIATGTQTTATNLLSASLWRARAATVASTAAQYASVGAKYAAAGASYVLTGGLYAAAAGAWAMLAPFWPILAVGAAIAGLFYMWTNNTFGLRDALTGAAGTLATFLNPVERFRWLLAQLTSFDVSDIPLIGGALDKGIKAGESIAQGMAQGARQNKGLVGSAVGSLAGAADAMLPSSPAQKGPLASLDQAGPGLVSTLAQGIKNNQSPVINAAQSLAGSINQVLPGSPLAGITPHPTPAGGGGQSPNVNVDTPGGGPDVTINQTVEFNGGTGDLSEQRVRDLMSRATGELKQDLEDLFQTG